MIVYFSGSSTSITATIDLYRGITSKIRRLGHTLQNDWIENAYLRESNPALSKLSQAALEEIVHDAEASIEGAEVVIVEASYGSTFGAGYEVGLALRLKKPTLILIDENARDRSYAVGLKHATVFVEFYNETNLERIIELFIKANTVKKKDLRFNFVIDRQIYNHLRLRSFETGKTKAELLRDLLERDIQKG